MPIIKRVELYKALYEPLDKVEKKDLIRTETLKTLLGDTLDNIIETYNKIQKARIDLGNKDANETNTTLDDIADYWQAIHDLYVCYLEALKDNYNDIPINKILIYEAPPMPKDEKINYILAESCEECKEQCKACEESFIDIEKCKNSNDCIKWLEHQKRFVNKPSGAYCKTIEVLGEKKNVKEILVEKGILFIDLCPLPLPMTSKIRKEIWGKKFDSTDDKPLSVVLLEFALEFALKKGILISKKPIIAMGTPTATSQSIYYYFEKKKPNLRIKINNADTEVVDFSKLLNINKKYEKNRQILPLYASNIIAGSNTPNAELLKRIF